MLALLALSSLALAQDSYEDTFLSDGGAWDGGTVADGVLSLDAGGATLSLPPMASLTGRLQLRQRDAAALRILVGEATWTADYTPDGGLELGEEVLHFPHGHRTWVTETAPALEPDGSQYWEAGSILHCEVHHDEASGTWFLYYTGVMSPGYGYRQIGVATSTDAQTWTRYAGNPVITMDYSRETIDGIHAHMPTITADTAGTLHMFYACYQNDVGNRICHASSEDGLTWTRPDYGAGRMALDLGTAGSFDDASLREPDVSLAPDGTMQMLYTGTSADEHYGPVGLARSLDGGWTWERVAQLTSGESELQGGTVLQSAYGLEQWYQCNDAFCFAESTGVDETGGVDWTEWTMYSDPVLTKNWALWNSGYIQAPSAWLVDGRVIHIWFNAYDYGTGIEVLGHARSAPVPDQWVTVDLAWDGTSLGVSFEGGPTLTTPLSTVSSLRIETDGQAELDEIRLDWVPVEDEDTGGTDGGDTSVPDSGDEGGGEDGGDEGGGDEGGDEGDAETPTNEEPTGCACSAGGVAGLGWWPALLVLGGVVRRRRRG